MVGSDLVVVHSGFAIMVVVEVVATDVVRFFFFFLKKKIVRVILAFWCPKVAFFFSTSNFNILTT